MKAEKNDLSTKELWTRLFSAPSMDGFFFNNEAELPDFSAYINYLCEEKQKRPADVLRDSNIDISYGYRLFSGERKPSRDKILQLAFGLGLNVDETQYLLKLGRGTALHPKVKRDAAIAFCLTKKMTLVDAQMILQDNDLPLIGGAGTK